MKDFIVNNKIETTKIPLGHSYVTMEDNSHGHLFWTSHPHCAIGRYMAFLRCNKIAVLNDFTVIITR